ncbi:MAG TPA: GtrA family protein [Candidatus Saccharimonadales bacterium]
MVKKVLKNKRLVKYFVAAVIIVFIELAVFQILYLVTEDSYFSTTASFIFAVILNWVASRLFVFGASVHHPLREFLMVFIASIVGLGIQLGVVYVSVSVLLLYPLIGKVLSIFFSFFWNYLFRSKIIYREKV